MITNEDKHQQAVIKILAATRKKRFAQALLEEAERELKAGKKLLEEAQRISTEILIATSGSGEGPEQPGRYEDLAASLAGKEE